MNIVQLCEAPERKLQTMCSPDWRAISSMSKPKGPAVLSVGKGRVFPSVSVKPPPFCVRLDPTLVSPSVSVKPPPLPRGVSSLWAWLVATVTTSDQVRPACWLVTVRVVRYSQCHSFGSPNSDLEVTQPFPLLALPPHPSFLILLPAVTCFPRSTLNPCMSGEQIGPTIGVRPNERSLKSKAGLCTAGCAETTRKQQFRNNNKAKQGCGSRGFAGVYAGLFSWLDLTCRTPEFIVMR
eukprot:1144001-Pelagomonas_calceolata.AAC.2